MRFQKLGLRLSIIALTLIVVVTIGSFMFRKMERDAYARKTLRKATATVKGKAQIKFTDNDTFYSDEDGNKIPVRPGSEHWRVYYQIDDFDRLDASISARLLQSEGERAVNGRLRFFQEDKELFESTEIGDKVVVIYQWVGDDKIVVALAGSQKDPRIMKSFRDLPPD